MFKRVTKSDLRRLSLIEQRMTNRENKRACSTKDKILKLIRAI